MWKNPETIRDLLERNVADFPDREAFVSVSYRTREWLRHTWKEMDERSERLAAGLSDLGVKKGEKIAFLLTNSVECYYSYLAIHKLGAVFVPINVRLVPREVEYIVENSDADWMIAGHDFLPLVDQVRDRLHIKKIVGIEKEGQGLRDWVVSFSELIESSGSPPGVSIGPDDEADILYTSGTTGLPKGVVLTQANKVACGRLIGTSVDLSRLHYGVPRIQNVFPFFTSSGCSSVMMMWLYFAVVVILEETFDAVKTFETIEREHPTGYGGAPAMFVFLLNHPRFKEFDTSSVHMLISGAAAMPEEVIRKLQAAWPGIKVYNLYALTEAGTGGTTLNAADMHTKIGSVGHPWPPEQELRIVDDEGRDVQPGEVGEIILRGPNVMKEYYKNPEATAQTLRNGWLHTGDMGRCDDEGYLYFTDRKKDMIVRGGYNVYSVEVESVLYEHPAVAQCAVVAKPHPKLGEDVLAFVAPKPGEKITAEELHEFTRDKLADYKRPRDVRFIESMPINPTGKVDKRSLKAKYLAGKEDGSDGT
jgi:acyl-CoA synthetase (AMP-forming)/AMP-acid ligase II